jgi:CheY-like chemotaxis protein
VEDNAGDVALIRQALRDHRVVRELTVIGDGAAAIAFIVELTAGKRPCPDLIILDLNLPRRSGSEVLQHIRNSEACDQTSVVILSSSDAPSDRQEAARLGANKYLKKPSNFDDFLNIGSVLKDLLV